MLSASSLSRAALLILRELRASTQKTCDWPPGGEPQPQVRQRLFGAYLFVGDDELSSDLETFTQNHLRPLMEAWVPTLCEPLAPEFLMLPLGVKDAANSRLDGISMRCIIIENMPIGERDIPSRVTEYYDITDDSFKTAPCSMALLFSVHAPGADVMLAPEGNL